MPYRNGVQSLAIPLASTCLLLLAGEFAWAETYRVDQSAQHPQPTGLTWNRAFPELQQALEIATDADQIWVAQGTYLPDYSIATGLHTGDRAATFQLISGVKIYGGFPPHGGDGTFNARDPALHETILSGDLADNDVIDLPDALACYSGDGTPLTPGCEAYDIDDDNDVDATDLGNAENSYHVVTGNGLAGTTLLDGLTIAAGHAGAGIATEESGAGMHNTSGRPALSNCRFTGNLSRYLGAGFYNYLGTPNLSACVFDRNRSTSGGGALYTRSDDGLILSQCSFTRNMAANGGAIYNYYSTLIPTECTFTDNTSTNYGGAIFSGYSYLTATDCIFRGNVAAFQGGVLRTGSSTSAGRSTVMTGCLFERNQAGTEGGCIRVEEGNLFLEDCTFTDNSGEDGGAVFQRHKSTGRMELSGCSFTDNAATSEGGAVYVGSYANASYSINATMTDCAFTRNHSGGYGGGVRLGPRCHLTGLRLSFLWNAANIGAGLATSTSLSDVQLTDCTFYANSASAHGGGFYGGVYQLRPTIHCIFVGNSAGLYGGAVYRTSPGSMANCTIASNTAGTAGGGVYVTNSYAYFGNCIVWGNVDSSGVTRSAQIAHNPYDAPNIGFSCIQEGSPQWGISSYPGFLRDPDPGADSLWGTPDDDYGDLRIPNGSPCGDAGLNNLVPVDILTDLAGNPRFVDDGSAPDTGNGNPPIVDIGAYEAPGDCNGNGIPDNEDIDSDQDGYIDDCEQCPDDPAKHEPMVCGCGVPDVDSDGDGTLDCVDQCPQDPGKTEPLQCGCGNPETDTDEDGVADCVDACVFDPAKSQDIDSDGDGIIDCQDNCPLDPNPDQDVVCDDPTDLLRVKWDATGMGDGSSWTDAMTDLQDALAAAAVQPQRYRKIWVAAGRYTPSQTLDQSASFDLLNNVELYGGFSGVETRLDQRDVSDNPTILSGDLAGDDPVSGPSPADNSRVVVRALNLDDTPILDGFTIRGGYSTVNSGGGLFMQWSSPRVRQCTFEDNYAYYHAGAAYVYSHAPVFDDCVFRRNRCGNYGGAVFAGVYTTAVFNNCLFEENTATRGGAVAEGIAADERKTFTDCTFRNNSASYGGAIYGGSAGDYIRCVFENNHAVQDGGAGQIDHETTLLDCLVRGNTAGNYGGGFFMDAYSCDAQIINTRFMGNSAGYKGGGVAVYTAGIVNLVNCALVGNRATVRGGGLYAVWSRTSVTNTTVTSNVADGDSGGVVIEKGNNIDSFLINSIVWGNTAPPGQYQNDWIIGDVVVAHSCIGGSPLAGTNGNIDLNPLFIRPPHPGPDGQWDGLDDDYGDLRLAPGSPCIDAGDKYVDAQPNYGAHEPPHDPDLAGNPRVVADGSAIDRGAPPPPMIDMGPYESQGDCNGNAIPDELEPDGDADGAIDDCDECPGDPNKSLAGQCGCGEPDVDTDGDGTADCVDECPDDPGKTEPGQCGCGNPDTDSDGDGTADCIDNCPDDPEKTEPGQCGCGVPEDDSDGDGTSDCVDGCPDDPGKTAPGVCGCGIPDDDSDGDTVVDCHDNCVNEPNPDQRDRDGDGTGDACDDDIDGDGVPNDQDGCPLDPNRTDDADTDGDGILDCNDNCPDVPNPDQQNLCSPGPDVLCVDTNAFGAEDGSNWFNAFSRLDDALVEAALSGGTVTEIWVAAGTYVPEGGPYPNKPPAFMLVSGVGLYGGFAGDETQRDQRDPARHVTVLSADVLGNDVGGCDDPSRDDNLIALLQTGVGDSVTGTAVIDGFTLSGVGSATRGGASAISARYWDLTIHQCTFQANVAWIGGALDVSSGGLKVTNSAFIGNFGIGNGGAISGFGNMPTLIDNCLFEDNQATQGGGAIYYLDNATITNCEFRHNSVTSGGGGGAIYGINGSLIANCSFTANTAANGGAVFATGGNASLAGCTFTANMATGSGGGLWIGQGSGIEVVNSILWGNADSTGIGATAQIHPDGASVPQVNYSDIQGGWPGPGAGNLDLDPRFVRSPGPGVDGQWGTSDDDFGDLRLGAGSPCIDAGDNDRVPADAFDLDQDGDTTEPIPFDLAGLARLRDDPHTWPDTGNPGALGPPVVDMGAYEFVLVSPADLDGDGDVDEFDATIFESCASGPAIPHDATLICLQADFDNDNDVDQSDRAVLQRWLISPGPPP